MAVIEHGAETCAAVHPHIGDLARQGMGDLESIGKKHGVEIKGSWGNAPAHKFFVLMDAANAHVVNEMLIESKVFQRARCQDSGRYDPAGGGRLGSPAQSLPYGLFDLSDVLVIPIRPPGPEEASEAIPAPSRDDVNVEVRHALADPVVDGNERAVRVQAQLDRPGQRLDVREQGTD